MTTITVKVTGSTPLLMHNVRLANPTLKFAKELKRLQTAKRTKGSDADKIVEEMARVEWEGGLYFDDKLGPCIFPEMVRGAIIAGARLSRGGKTVERAVTVLKKSKLDYEGPRDIDGLWEAGFADQRMVTVNNAKIPRTRPVFESWATTFEVVYDDEVMKRDDLVRYVTAAGRYEGFGDGRSLGFGRFDVEIVKG